MGRNVLIADLHVLVFFLVQNQLHFTFLNMYIERDVD